MSNSNQQTSANSLTIARGVILHDRPWFSVVLPDASMLESCLPTNGARSMSIGFRETTKSHEWTEFAGRTSYCIRGKVALHQYVQLHLN